MTEAVKNSILLKIEQVSNPANCVGAAGRLALLNLELIKVEIAISVLPGVFPRLRLTATEAQELLASIDEAKSRLNE